MGNPTLLSVPEESLRLALGISKLDKSGQIILKGTLYKWAENEGRLREVDSVMNQSLPKIIQVSQDTEIAEPRVIQFPQKKKASYGP